MNYTGTKWLSEKFKNHVIRERVKVVCIYVSLLTALLILVYIKRHKGAHIPLEVDIPFDVDFADYEPFEPDITSDFETDLSKSVKIPRILHQTWKDTNIPNKFVKGVKSFAEYNPNWDYYLWTDDSARQFVLDHYPSLIGLWNGYAYKNDKIRIADAIRYVVLYHFGGVYADMDVINFRSLDGVTTKHGCVFMPEPYEQAILRGGVPFFINNAVMMCRAKHPFFKHLLDHLVDFEIMKTVWDSTGPGFLTTQYKKYFKLPREKGEFILYGNRSVYDKSETSPYFYQGDVPLTDERSIYIANSQYFLITLDQSVFHRYHNWCLKFNELAEMWKRACVNMKRKGLKREISRFAYTDHKWDFTYGKFNFFYYLPIYSLVSSTNIQQLVPNYKLYYQEET